MEFTRENPVEKKRRRAEEHHHSEERKHWAAQRRDNAISVRIAAAGTFISFLAFVAAGSAAYFAYWAYIAANSQAKADWVSARQSEKQADAAVEANRAWMNVGFDSASLALTWDAKKGPIFSGIIIGENEGNSPANNVSLYSELIINQGGEVNAVRARAQQACFNDTFQIAAGGSLVFIKEKTSQLSFAQIPWGDVMKFRLSLPATFNQIPMEVILCAAYNIIGTDTPIHFTVRVYDLDTGVYVPKGPWPLNPVIGKDIPRGSAVLVNDYNGDYTN